MANPRARRAPHPAPIRATLASVPHLVRNSSNMLIKVLLIGFVLFKIALIAFVAFFFWARQSDVRAGKQAGAVFSAPGQAQLAVTTTAAAPATHPTPAPARTIRFLTWNLAYGYGIGSEGVGYEPKSREAYAETLRKSGELIRSLGVDIAVLQEVDFASSRSHDVDQSVELARVSGLTHRAPVVSWQNRYVPFPYWPPSRHFGRVAWGGAVLSRFPIAENRVHIFEKPSEQPFWYNSFYPNRYIQWVRVSGAGGDAWVGNLHLDAFHEAARRREAAIVLASMPEGRVLGLGGDFNSELGKSDGVQSIQDGWKGRLEAQNAGGATFPSNQPTQQIDHGFFAPGSVKSQRVVTEAGTLSDHLPILWDLEVR